MGFVDLLPRKDSGRIHPLTQENKMASKSVSGVLILALSFALCIPVQAQSSGKIVSNGTIAGVIVGVAAGVAVIVIVAVHYSKKRTVTGCINSAADRMTVSDEKDRQVYELSGDTTGIKPGDRMTLQGKKAKSTGSTKPPTWEVKKVSEDFGVCRP
jgi:hypothetical protein